MKYRNHPPQQISRALTCFTGGPKGESSLRSHSSADFQPSPPKKSAGVTHRFKNEEFWSKKKLGTSPTSFGYIYICLCVCVYMYISINKYIYIYPYGFMIDLWIFMGAQPEWYPGPSWPWPGEAPKLCLASFPKKNQVGWKKPTQIHQDTYHKPTRDLFELCKFTHRKKSAKNRGRGPGHLSVAIGWPDDPTLIQKVPAIMVIFVSSDNLRELGL